ncbi:MAG TPA: acetoacetate decarboxylase family protein [Nitriliruptoraceae bacterium]|nr:acetoacetate decarboxylase family protein [Nitriliruptoraceae bacterium]
MASQHGFIFPRTATGRSSILPPPPWHYSGDLLTIEYRTDPDRVIELLPEQMEPADDPGAVALVWADWQSCGDDFRELVDPVQSQYKEVFFVIRGRYRGEHRSRCAYIWVDKDFALVRGHFQGYPKKLGSVWMTRPVAHGKAGPRLAPGGRFGATLAAGDRRLAEATFTITGEVETGGFVNSHAMVHSRYMPAIEADGRASLHELVTMKAIDVDAGPIFAGDAELELYDVPGEEYPQLAPSEMIGAFYQQIGVTFPGGTTLEDLTTA